tara:strand:+ start:4838 stop:4981 length:144 start_codon:yes stop_codon:yes gene_type:complete
MNVYVTIEMYEGLLSEVTVSKSEPDNLDTSDEYWDNGIKVFQTELED